MKISKCVFSTDSSAPFISFLRFCEIPRKGTYLAAGDMGEVANAGSVGIKQHTSVIAKFDGTNGKLEMTRM